MEYGICTQSIIPVRTEPSHRSEMSTQLLFGESYLIAERQDLWIRIRLTYDNYEGWIHHKQVKSIAEAEFIRLSGANTAIAADLVQLISEEKSGLIFPVLLGSSLPWYASGQVLIDGEIFSFDGSAFDPATDTLTGQDRLKQLREQVVRDARMYLHAPYLWGGRSPFGIDCSGFVQMAYKLANIRLLRDAGQQAAQGEVISLLAEAEPGDLVFFDDVEGNINHVGMICDRNRVIHSSGKVRIDALDHEGIFNLETQRYTHKLRLIRRII